ncbi:ComEA family DNA-binding protein [Nitrosomonas ureae]|uniref:Competence protein ComEA n=1 Tax=Nitrosomonas ureae TaxID=44577 RepID=A0A0S3AGF0_9PROT|nr:ComEA family DNA-binding protein [Nitrosomonas ureae]ALQ50250.1 competence protein ComE [Nitrosomonas ureae]PTQ88687.1 competence protein ComEA [Nitrosomonas ureae]PXX18358.1 competence protein ComEA [Nitrosomonas ureae]SDU14883.1 competence protein ComEA [Nitrosomonas ureae]SEQ01918.1 competence protein ComEA [Nitrosomonas ureae]
MQKWFLLMALVFLFTGTAFAAVNINTASQAELESLQGIGPAKAKAIIEHREKSGTFASVDDLAKVSGIGQGTIKQLRDVITVEGEKATEAPAKQE